MAFKFPSTYKPSSKLDYFYDRPGVAPGELSLSADAEPATLCVMDYGTPMKPIAIYKLTLFLGSIFRVWGIKILGAA
jgi:hypothetical protein